jgi:uncharacterized protein with PIN domain
MKSTEHILHTAKLNNNCPECFANDGLEFSFVQEEMETKFYTKSQEAVNETLYCHGCKHIIYPVNWTDDIERVYEYHKKQAVPKDSRLRLKPISFGFIFLCVGIIAAVIYFIGSS